MNKLKHIKTRGSQYVAHPNDCILAAVITKGEFSTEMDNSTPFHYWNPVHERPISPVDAPQPAPAQKRLITDDDVQDRRPPPPPAPRRPTSEPHLKAKTNVLATIGSPATS